MQSVAFNPDGTRLVTGGDDRMVRLWDVGSGSEIAALQGHENWVRSVAFNPDGTRLISGGDDGTVRLWDMGRNEEIAALRGHEGRVWSVAFSPDGRRIASGGDDNTVRLWDVGRNEETATLRGHTGSVQSVAFNLDGTRLVTGGDDRMVRLWDVGSGSEIAALQGHEDWVQSVAFSPDGRLIASGGDDRMVRLWDVGSGSEIAALQGHEDWVQSVAFSPDGRLIASGGDDNTVRLWDVGSGSEIAALQGHEDWVQSVAFNLDGTRLVTGGNDGTVRLWGLILVTPPLLIWILLPAAIFNLFVCVRIFSTAWRAITVLQSNVPALVSDRPIADLEQATAEMRKVVTRISRFVHNSNASAPLTFALTGKWGSGKSSLMQLIWKDLRKDHCPCVWFNAWHHQNETHLFAALMESIRLNAVPRSLLEIGRSIEFRINLIWQRSQKTPIAAITFVIVIPGVLLWLGWKDFVGPWLKPLLLRTLAKIDH